MNGIHNIKGKTSVNVLVSNYSNKHVTFNKGEYAGHLEPTIDNIDKEKNLLLKMVGILWNRTSVEVVDKLSSTSVDFIRSERELKTCPYIESKMLTEHAQRHAEKCESENPKGEGEIGKWKGGKLKEELIK